jgi:TolB-like protein/DNA-binding winged helix-turn-helix (wHTH) protein/Tfp pilus assembly protein PilF
MTGVPAPRIYRFGEFELDLGAHQLRRNGMAVSLERRPFQLLALLVGRRGLMVAREEIIASLWPARVVIDFDTGLNTLVRKVRLALGDSPETQAFIETVPGVGYRFVAEVIDVPAREPGVAGESNSPPARAGGRRGHAWAAGAAVLLLVGAIATGRAWLWPAPHAVSLVVLPFENLTQDEAFGYLAAGLAEDTNASLAQLDLQNLRLVGRATALVLARSGKSEATIGRELGVDYVVASSLLAQGSKVRVTSRLVRVADNAEVWTATFDRELTSTLGLQRELSIAIAEQVRLRLSPEVSAAVARRQTQNPKAYDLYLRGRYAWSRISPAGNRQALEYFEQAIAADPDYALAWSGILHVLSTAPITGEVEPTSIRARANAAAEHLLGAGADLAEAQLALGYYRFMLDWDWASAESAWRKAVALDPNSALAHLMLGHVLSQVGSQAEAREFAKRARELDPFFSHVFALSATIAYQDRDFAAAAEFGRQAVAINPEGWVGHLNLAQPLAEIGDHAAALAAYDQAMRYSGGNCKSRAYRAHLLARMGRTEEARAELKELVDIARTRYVPAYTIAVVHAGLGEADQAFAWLERGLEARDIHFIFLPVDPRWDSLRADPRFVDLLRRAGMPATAPAAA